MSMNVKCPKCGSEHVQLSNEEHRRRSLIWLILFGWEVALFRFICRITAGITLLVCVDWWMAIIKSCQKKGYIWKCKRFFVNRKRIYYCHDCGYNFRV